MGGVDRGRVPGGVEDRDRRVGASGVLTRYATLDEATALVDYAVDRIFGTG
jgi:hypothetical protein